MEHILQFGISIDDDAIKRNIESSATRKLADELIKDSKALFFNKWGDGFSESGREIIMKFLNDNKDEIIERASKDVASSMKRSKKYREALASIVEDDTDDRK